MDDKKIPFDVSSSFLKMQDIKPITIQDIKPEKVNYSIKLDTSNYDRALESVRRANQEKIDRENKNIQLLEQLVAIAKDKPEIADRYVNTLITDSTIQNMQNVYGNSTGIQNITNNTGIEIEDYQKILSDMKEFFSLLNEDKSVESQEVLEQLDNELKKGEPKKGIIKASIIYLSGVVNEVILDPLKALAKKQFIEFAIEKAPFVIDGLDKIKTFIMLDK